MHFVEYLIFVNFIPKLIHTLNTISGTPPTIIWFSINLMQIYITGWAKIQKIKLIFKYFIKIKTWNRKNAWFVCVVTFISSKKYLSKILKKDDDVTTLARFSFSPRVRTVLTYIYDRVKNTKFLFYVFDQNVW